MPASWFQFIGYYHKANKACLYVAVVSDFSDSFIFGKSDNFTLIEYL